MGTIYRSHLQNWPVLNNLEQYKKQFEEMELLKKLIHLGQRVREENNLRLRQPLSVVYLDKNLQKQLSLYEDLLLKSLNVKCIQWSEQADLTESIITLNSAVLGKKYRSEFKAINLAFNKSNYTVTAEGLVIAGKTLTNDEYSIQFKLKENTCGAQDDNVWLNFNTQLTSELIHEGNIRDFMRKLQELRKQNGFKLNQIVDICVGPKLANLIENLEKIVFEETGCNIVYEMNSESQPHVSLIEIGNLSEQVQLKLASIQPTTKLNSSVLFEVIQSSDIIRDKNNFDEDAKEKIHSSLKL